MKPSVPTVLSFNGGYVDTIGFLSLHGLFTAHVTGNFVTIGDALAHGSSGIVSKLLALPVFCATILITRLIALRMASRDGNAMAWMLGVKCLLLALAAALALYWGGFSDADGAPLIVTGMLLVAAMAIQNGIHRVHLASAPPTTLMTGTTTQVMLDLASLMTPAAGEDPAMLKTRLVRLSKAVVTFALGCALAALAYIKLGMGCFVLPPLLALLSLALHRGTRPA